MQKKKTSQQTKLRKFFDRNKRSRQGRSKGSRRQNTKSLTNIQDTITEVTPPDKIVFPVEGLTDFGAFARPQLDISSIINFGLIFKLLDIKCLITQDNKQKETLHLYGVTENQNSVLIHVNNFCCSVIAGFQSQMQSQQQELDLEQIKGRLNQKLKKDPKDTHEPVTKIQIFKKEPTMSQVSKALNSLETQYLKFFISHVKYVEELRKILKDKSKNDIMPTLKELDDDMETYYKLHFLKDTNISIFGWVFIQPEDLHYRGDTDRISTCQIEVDVQVEKLIPLPKTEEDDGSWPLRIMSFDLECEAVANEGFPRAERRPIIQIANTCRVIERTSIHDFKNIFVVGSCAQIEGADIYSYPDDDRLLRNWRAFIHTFDPDIMIGYNIIGFDFRYISKRAQKQNIADFFALGRLKNLKYTSSIDPFVEKLNVDGRIILDMTSVVRGECPGLPRYGLGAVSQALLNETKCDVHYSELYDLQHGNADTRKKIAVYCIQDTNLPMKLLDKLEILKKYAHRTREMGILFQFAVKKNGSSRNAKFANSYIKSTGGQSAYKERKDPKKLYRSTTQVIGNYSGLTSVESLLETFSGPFVFKVSIPALYKKQNYKLGYLKINRLFLKVYTNQTLEAIAYLTSQAFEELHEKIEKVDEIFVTKWVVEEPKPGQKILRICNAMPLDINSKAIEALKSITSMVWVNNSSVLYGPKEKEKKKEKEESDSEMDLDLIEEVLNSIKEKDKGIENSQEKGQKLEEEVPKPLERMTSSQKTDNSSSKQKMLKRSFSALNQEYPLGEYPLGNRDEAEVKKKQKMSTSVGLSQEKVPKDIVSTLYVPSDKQIYIPCSFLCYPNLKWIVKCIDKPTEQNKENQYTQSVVDKLVKQAAYQLKVVNPSKESHDNSARVLTEEVCMLSDCKINDIENHIRKKLMVPKDFSLMNAVFAEKNDYYFIVHSSCVDDEIFRSTSQDASLGSSFYFLLKIQKVYEYLFS